MENEGLGQVDQELKELEEGYGIMDAVNDAANEPQLNLMTRAINLLEELLNYKFDVEPELMPYREAIIKGGVQDYEGVLTRNRIIRELQFTQPYDRIKNAKNFFKRRNQLDLIISAGVDRKRVSELIQVIHNSPGKDPGTSNEAEDGFTF